ncbi:hypothetical protein GCM10010433_22090 [Streptomyces pulveraceus]
MPKGILSQSVSKRRPGGAGNGSPAHRERAPDAPGTDPGAAGAGSSAPLRFSLPRGTGSCSVTASQQHHGSQLPLGR